MHLTIKHKLILLGAIAILAILFLATVSYKTNNFINAQVAELNASKQVSFLDDTLISNQQQIALLQYQIVQQKDSGINEKYLTEIATSIERAKESLKEIIELKLDYLKQEELLKGQKTLETMIKDTEAVVQAAKQKASASQIDALLKQQQESTKLLKRFTGKIYNNVEDRVIALGDGVTNSVVTANKKLLIVAVITCLILIPFIVLIIVGITKPLAAITAIIEKLSKGNYGVVVNGTQNKDEIGTIARAVFELRNAVEKSITLQTMIDQLSIPIILTNKEFVITYANKASLSTLKKIEKVIPQAGNIIGCSIDVFYNNPEEQRQVLSDPDKLPFKSRIAVGDEWLYVTANMLTDTMNQFNGSFMDWQIVTEDFNNEQAVKRAQQYIRELIDMANDGDLTQRIDADQFDGFYREVALAMNGLIDTIREPINNSIEALTLLSKGDLTHIMEGEYKGSFAQIQGAVNTTIDQLKSMVMQIKDAAESVNVASTEISTGSADLAGRTEHQASNLEETAASMEELTATVNANSENAGNANNLSRKARDIAEKGGTVVEEAVTAMSNIEKSSQKIADIIGVIDEIAFQTNLLALNAAVEAARAGDAGKGFAVVASEVRTLAGRSASASKEIKQLINESSVEVRSGAALVNQAGATLQEIVTSVRQVADIVSEITAATVEQSSGILEINQAISQMDEATQQNAALVEENTAAAQSLVDQASNLSEMMQFFTLNEAKAMANQYVPLPVETVANVSLVPSSTPVRPVVVQSVPKKMAASNGTVRAKDDGWEEF